MAEQERAPPIKRYRREELKDASSDDEWNIEDSENNDFIFREEDITLWK